MPTPVVATKPGEYTRVGLETEVKVPWLTYVFNSLVLMIVDTGFWVIGCLIWFRARVKVVSFWRWLKWEWVAWFVVNWPWYVVTLILCWIGPSALSYLYRLTIEQLAKSTPTYDNLDPNAGIWNPLGRAVYEDEDEPEMELETVDVNVTVERDGQGPRILTLPSFLLSQKACMFYRAVSNEAATFTQRGAARFGLSRDEFDTHIRDPLIARRLATWKNKRHPNLGVNLSDEAVRTLGHLGRHPPARE